MSTAASIAIKVAELQHCGTKLRSLMSYIHSSINQLPPDEKLKARQLRTQLEVEVKNIIEILTDDLKKNPIDRREKENEEIGVKKSPADIKRDVKLESENINWFPKSSQELFSFPYDIYRGIINMELKCDNQCKLHPLSLFSQLWTSFYTSFMFLYAILLPLGFAFDNLEGILLPLTICLTIVIIADTFLKLNTGIVVEQELEMDRNGVLKHHIKEKTILFNVLTGFPYIVIVNLMFSSGSVSRKSWQILCLLNAIAFPRMFTGQGVSLISEFITKTIQRYEINQSLTKSVYIIAGMAFYWHWYSCAIAYFQWFQILPDAYPLLEDSDHYAVFFFESASITFSAAWGAIPPVTTHDRLSKVFNMVVSAFMLALFTANITTFMIRLDTSGRLFAEKMEEINQYLLYKGLGRDLQKRIMQYYHFKYSGGKYFDEKRILAELNQPLRVSISMRECKPLIMQVPFFKDADHSFITQVVTILQVCHFLPDDFIIEQGTTGDQMFFIESGTAEVIVNEKPVAILTSGQYFGEITLLFGHMKRTASIKAVTECVLYSLSQSDMESILEINPVMADRMRETAEDRLRFNQASLNIQKTNSKQAIVELIDQTYTRDNVNGFKNATGNENEHPINIEPTQKKPDIYNAPKLSLVDNATQTLDFSIQGSKKYSYVLPFVDPKLLEKNLVLSNSQNLHREDGTSQILGKSYSKSQGLHPKSISQISLDHDPTSVNEILSDIESKEILEHLQTARRRSSAMNFIGMGFVDKHTTNTHPEQLNMGTEVLTIESSNGKKEQIEIHRRKKRQSNMDRKALSGSNILSILSEKQEQDVKSLGSAVNVKEDVMDGKNSPKLGSVVASRETFDQFSKPSLLNNEKTTGQETKSNKSLKVRENQAGEVKIDMSGKIIDDEFDDDTPKKVTNRKVMKQEPVEVVSDNNFEKMNRPSLSVRLQRLWNKFQPSSKYCPFHPDMIFSRIWNSIFQVAFFFVAVLLPLPFGFESLKGMLPGISIFVCIMTILDLFVKMQTGYVLFEEIEMEPKRLAIIFTKNGHFFFDFITGVPWVFIIDAATSNNQSLQDWARLFCLLHGLPFLKSLLDSRKSYLSEALTEYIRKNDINISGVQAVKILGAIIFYWHWHSCSANYIMRMDVVPNPYPNLFGFNSYTLHFWTSATEMMNAGCGAVPPAVTADRWLKVFNMICNCTLVALFVGNISSFMIGLDSSGRQFNEQLEQVSQYISYKGLGRELKNKILAYYQLKYSRGKYFDEEKILSELNHPLRLAIYMRECRALIIQVPFFKGADNGFISQVVMILKPCHFLPDDLVIEKGTAGDFMFFIASGNLEVMVDNVAVVELTPGQFFGEIALLFGHMKRTATIRAKTNCSLYSLSRSDLDSILEVYPEMAEKLQKTAEERIGQDLIRNLGKVQNKKPENDDDI